MTATGYREHVEELVFTSAEPIVQRDFVLEPAVMLRVRLVTPGGELLGEAWKELGSPGALPLPVATLEDPSPAIEGAIDAGHESIGVGAFRNDGPFAEAAGPGFSGVLVLAVDPPVFVSLLIGEHVLATQRVELGVDAVTFVVDPEELLARQARLSARFVREDTGEDLLGIVLLSGGHSLTTYTMQESSWSTTLAPGHYRMSLLVQGYAFSREVVLDAGQELDLGEVRVPPEATIGGRLVDAAGRPLRGRLALGERDASGVLRFRDAVNYSSDPSGSFRIGGLARGRYVLHSEEGDAKAEAAWVLGNVPVSTLGGSVQGLELRFVRAGILVLKGGARLPAGTRLRILDEHGDLLRAGAFFLGFVPRFALPPGPCTLVLQDAKGIELLRRTMTIGAGVNELDPSR